MATFTADIDSPLSAGATFAYVGDFANTEEWDPGVAAATRLTEGPPGVGTVYRLMVKMFGRARPLTYLVTEWKPAQRVVLETSSRLLFGRDVITVAPSARGSKLGYEATVRMKGVLRVMEPLLGIAMKRIGTRALEGLQAALDRRAEAAAG